MSEKMLITAEHVRPLEIFVEGKYRELLEFIKNESKIDEPDVSTSKGRSLIRSMSAMVASSKVFVVKAGKKLADDEKAKIEEKLTAINGSKSFIEDSLVYLKAEVREPLTKWEESEKAKKDAEIAEQERIKQKAIDDEKAEIERQKQENEAEKERLEKEQMQLNANQKAIKDFGSVSQNVVNDALKNQGAAEAETDRIRQKAIDDEKQAKIDQEKAVEAERLRVQQIADDKESNRLQDERVKREAEQEKAADTTHRKLNNEALSGLIKILKVNDSLPDIDEIGKRIIVAIIQGKIPNVSINY